MRALQVLHLAHTNDVGGVQTIVAKLAAAAPEDVDYRTAVFAAGKADEVTLFEPDLTAHGLNHPLSVFRLLREIRRTKPEVLVCSLWRSVLVGCLAKLLLRRRLTFVVFLHSSAYTQPVDRLAHMLGLRLADAVFSDSEATARALLSDLRGARFPAGAVVEPPLPAITDRVAPTHLKLVFWGRLAAAKRIDRALDLLARVRAQEPEATLTLIGPSAGLDQELHRHAREVGVESAVTWLPAVPQSNLWPLVRDAAFFVQLSDFEGRALSVIEAMRWGLVPVVTPVGEIGSFCNSNNAIVVHDLDSAATELVAIWRQRDRWQAASANAAARWAQADSDGGNFFQLCRSSAGRPA